MKKLLLLLLFIPLTLGAWAQYVPGAIDFSGVASDAEGYPIANKEIVVEITILKDTNTGSIEWQEIHYPTTDDFGGFWVGIGQGISTPSSQQADFENIDWTTGRHFLKVRVDFGASNVLNGFQDFGESEFLAVPYARVAAYALSAPIPSLSELTDVQTAGLKTGDVLKWDGTSWSAQDAIDESIFVKRDGSTDLTGDWTIDTHSINMNYGTLTLNQGNIILDHGSLTAKSLVLNGNEITKMTTDVDLSDVDDKSLASSNAIKTYVDSRLSNSGNGWTVEGNAVYNTDSYIGIGTSAPQHKVHIKVDDDAFFVEGYERASANFRGVDLGTYMFFFPGKSALRAGTLNLRADIWDDDNLGEHSQAFGEDNLVSGKWAVGFGNYNDVRGPYSVAFGEKNTISAGAGRNIVSGKENEVTGNLSAIFGYKNVSQGLSSLIVGDENISKANQSIVVGYANEMTRGNQGALCVGTANNAKANYAITLGNGCTTSISAEGAAAIGLNNTANGEYSAAFGTGNNTVTFAEMVIGSHNMPFIPTGPTSKDSWVTDDPLFIIGNGVSESDRKNAFVVFKNGDIQHSGTISQSSDKRLKKNINTLSGSLQKLQNIRGVSYNWDKSKQKSKTFTHKKQIGVIAQEVEAMYPELVSTDASGYKTVNYIGLVPVLIEALKEQQKEIEALKKETNSKSAQLNQVNQKFEALNQRLSQIEQLLLKPAQGK